MNSLASYKPAFNSSNRHSAAHAFHAKDFFAIIKKLKLSTVVSTPPQAGCAQRLFLFPGNGVMSTSSSLLPLSIGPHGVDIYYAVEVLLQYNSSRAGAGPAKNSPQPSRRHGWRALLAVSRGGRGRNSGCPGGSESASASSISSGRRWSSALMMAWSHWLATH